MVIIFNIIFISFSLILCHGFNETFYKHLKNHSEYEIVDINNTNISIKRKMNWEDAKEEITITDVLTLAEVIYSLYSGNIDVDGIEYLVERVVEIGLFDSLPKKYNFIEKHKIKYDLDFSYSQRECEPSAGYAVALLASYRRYTKTESYESSRFVATPIMEHFGRCNKFNLLDALDYAHNIGLVTYSCRSEIYCSDCGHYTCVTLENRFSDTPKTETPYKIGEYYKVKGKENIQKEIYENGPVITTYTLYDSMVYYKSGYVSKGTGIKVGTHEAVIYGYDKEGWLAQSVIGRYWGNNGMFNVSYDNDFGFGEIAFAEYGEKIKTSIYILMLILILLL